MKQLYKIETTRHGKTCTSFVEGNDTQSALQKLMSIMYWHDSAIKPTLCASFYTGDNEFCVYATHSATHIVSEVDFEEA